MEFVAATNNLNKLAEIRRILEAQGHQVRSMAEAGISLEVEETGVTFVENALLKARAVCAACGKPVIADDSGLCVDALAGAPGVYSARFAGAHGDDAANNRKLLDLLAHTPYNERTAQFVCAIALAMPDGTVLTEEGRCEGLIGFEPAGENGFGYDPLFYVQGKSFAQMRDEEKDAISHRAVALRQFAAALSRLLREENGEGTAAGAPAT